MAATEETVTAASTRGPEPRTPAAPPRGPEPRTPAAPPRGPEPRTPAVALVVDDVHVEYRVLATGRRATGVDAGRRLLQRRSRDTRTVHALRGVSFTAHQGESIGVIGANGSGKSTLMRAITGLAPTTAGTVHATTRPSLLGVGAALIKDLSGERNVELGSLALGLTPREAAERRDEIVELSGIGEFIDLPMRTYSSGMTARLKFAIASVRDHDILIIDEALAVGDAAFRERSEERIRQIQAAAGTVFLVSHSMRSVRETCDRTLWIERGRLRMDGPTDAVVTAYEASH